MAMPTPVTNLLDCPSKCGSRQSLCLLTIEAFWYTVLALRFLCYSCVTSLLASTICLPRLVEDAGHAQRVHGVSVRRSG